MCIDFGSREYTRSVGTVLHRQWRLVVGGAWWFAMRMEIYYFLFYAVNNVIKPHLLLPSSRRHPVAFTPGWTSLH